MESEYLLFITSTRACYRCIRGKEDLATEAINRLTKRIGKGSIVSVIIHNPRYKELK